MYIYIHYIYIYIYIYICIYIYIIYDTLSIPSLFNKYIHICVVFVFYLIIYASV